MIYTGNQGAARRLRFRLQNVQVQTLPNRNLGTEIYEKIPTVLMMVTRIFTIDGDEVIGTWRTSETAMKAAGFNGENYDPLHAGDTRIYRLAAYTPPGIINRLTYLLDVEGKPYHVDQQQQSVLFRGCRRLNS